MPRLSLRPRFLTRLGMYTRCFCGLEPIGRQNQNAPTIAGAFLTKVVPEVELDAQHLHHQDRHQWTVVLRPLPNAKLSLLHSSLSYEPTANVASTRLQRLDQELNLRHLHMTRSRGSLTARSGVTRSATTQKSANSGTRIPERSWPRLRIAARCLPIPEFSG